MTISGFGIHTTSCPVPQQLHRRVGIVQMPGMIMERGAQEGSWGIRERKVGRKGGVKFGEGCVF